MNVVNLVLLIVAWTIYFFLHSFLATDLVKSFLKRVMGQGFRFYRLIYSLISTLGLAFLFLLNGLIPSSPIFESVGILRYTGLVLAAWGVIVIRLAFREYNLSSFLGLQSEEEGTLKRNGILRNVRHPIYTGIILLVFGFILVNPKITTLVSSICILLCLAIGIYFEEEKLIKTFGDSYRRYQEEVPMLFPRLKIW